MTAQAGDTFLSITATRKQALRRELRRLRAAIDRAERRRAARLTAWRLLRLRRLRRARRIAVYFSQAHELDTAPLISELLRRCKQLAAPRVDRANRMHLVTFDAASRPRRDALGMPAPPGRNSRQSCRRFDVVIVPLLGFDAQGGRLGQGGGYYDRTLGFNRIGARPWLLGYAYAQQRVAQLDHDPWDVKLDAVALESGVCDLKRQRLSDGDGR